MSLSMPNLNMHIYIYYAYNCVYIIIVIIIIFSAYKCILSIFVSQQNGLILSRRPRTIYPSHVSCSMDFGRMWIWIPIAGFDSNLGNTVEHHRNVTNSTFLIMRKWWYNWYNNVKHEILRYRTSDCWRRSASFFLHLVTTKSAFK